MFEQTFVSRPGQTRSPAAIAISFLGQTVILASLLAAPLFRPYAIHPVLSHTMLEPPRPLRPAAETPTAAAHVTTARPVFRPNVLQAPSRIPRQIAWITDPAPDLSLVSQPGEGTSSGMAAPGVFSGLEAVAKPQPVPARPAAVPKRAPGPVRVSAGVQAARLLSQTKPEYPSIARAARVSGPVVLQAVIGKDGSIQKLQVLSGNPLLTRAALDAVALWRYQPTLLGGEPVEVATQITVNFVLTR